MKKKCLILILALALCVGLAACGQLGNSTKGEKALAQDLAQHRSAEMDQELEAKDLTIEKRQTAEEDRLDTVYVRASLEDAAGTMRVDGAYTMTYGLYNDGWLLETVEITEEAVQPLVGPPDYSLEQLSEFLMWQGYTGLTDVNLYHQSLDLENSTATYSLTARDIHTYLTEDLDVTLTFRYGYYFSSGAPDWNIEPELTVNSSTEDWSAICGAYTSSGESGVWTIDSFDGNTIVWDRNESVHHRDNIVSEVVDLRLNSLDEAILDYNGNVSSYVEKYYYERYSIQYVTADGPLPLGSIRYFADGWLIGPDQVYRAGNRSIDLEIDKGRHQLKSNCWQVFR